MAYTVVLITGANSGVGFATSKVLVNASETYHVIMAGRSLDKVKAALSEIQASGTKGKLSALQLDVTDEQSVEDAAAHVRQQVGQLDVLINNAASGCNDDNIKKRFQVVLETNVMGPAMVTAAFRPLLLEASNPYLINVSSGARTLVKNAHEKPRGHEKLKNPGAYQVSKAALNMLTALEARDYEPQGLKVFAVSPGFVRSNLRGPSEEEQGGWGMAMDAEVSGQLLLSVIQGKRDADRHGLVHKDGVFSW